MKKESFLLYKSFYAPIKGLPREIKGELLDSIFDYQIDGTEPDPSSPVYIAFQFIKNQFSIDEAKYLKICERNRRNGSKSEGRPKTTQEIPNETKRTEKTHSVITEPKKPDNDNDNDNDNEEKEVNKKDPPDLVPSKEKIFAPEIRVCVNKLVKYFPESIQETLNFDKWDDCVDKLNRLDGLTFERIEEIVKFAREDNFWKTNFLSLLKLRKKNPEEVKYYVVFNEQLKLKKRYKGSKGSDIHDTDFN